MVQARAADFQSDSVLELMRSNVGAGLLAMASSQPPHHFGFLSTRNALALASTSKYITRAINNGRMK
ncbi:hypothetical protein PS726_06467 [Pseudomonas fluorescens]|nr:hypothetical protein PS726_06467 [Pseudomonas fluorescens]